MPAVVFPQILLCGLFVPTDKMPDVAAGWSRTVLPLTYAVEAMQASPVTTAGGWAAGGGDLAVVLGFVVVGLLRWAR